MQPSPSADTAGPVAPSLRCFLPTAYGLTGDSRLAAPYDLSALAEHCPASPNLSARSASLIPGGYANYMQADEPLDRVRAAFGPRLIRAPPGLAVALRPGQRSAPQPKYSAGHLTAMVALMEGAPRYAVRRLESSVEIKTGTPSKPGEMAAACWRTWRRLRPLLP